MGITEEKQKGRRCHNCTFGIEAEKSENVVYCRRYPPQLVTIVEGVITSRAIAVNPNHWCGEHRRKRKG